MLLELTYWVSVPLVLSYLVLVFWTVSARPLSCCMRTRARTQSLYCLYTTWIEKIAALLHILLRRIIMDGHAVTDRSLTSYMYRMHMVALKLNTLILSWAFRIGNQNLKKSHTVHTLPWRRWPLGWGRPHPQHAPLSCPDGRSWYVGTRTLPPHSCWYSGGMKTTHTIKPTRPQNLRKHTHALKVSTNQISWVKD